MEEEKHCLNCGEPLTGRYCANCGQSADTERLTFKRFLGESVYYALHLDKKILPTVGLLVTKPWKVIREYIHGRRVSYTQPVHLMVVLLLLNVFEAGFLGMGSSCAHHHTVDMAEDTTLLMSLWLSFKGFVLESKIFIAIISSFIITPVVWLIYLPFGSRRYRFAEYCTAYLYMSCIALALDLFSQPWVLLSETALTVVQGLELVWIVVLAIRSLHHVFPIKSRGLRFIMTFLPLLVMMISVVFLGVFSAYIEAGR